MANNVISFSKRKYIIGDFFGNYVGEYLLTKGNFNLSKINITSAELRNAVPFEIENLRGYKNLNTFDHSKFDIKVSLSDSSLNDNYVFVENFDETVILNPEITNPQKDGKNTIGNIYGKMICCLVDNFDSVNVETKKRKKIVFQNDQINFFLRMYNRIKVFSKNSFKKISNFIKK